MHKRVTWVAAWAWLLLSPIASAAEERYAATMAVARKEAAAALASDGVFSVTTAVLVDGRIVYAEAFGTIGAARDGRPDARTQFNAGSLSKVFTAVAMLRLRDEGKVDLDRPVVEYLPEFRMNDPRYSRITVRMLLDHTSGMPGTNYYDLFASGENPGYLAQTLSALEGSALKSDPGDANVYCNDCFTVAQAIIERLSGVSLAEFVEREIFAKAGMADSGYGFRAGNANVAMTYGSGATAVVQPREDVNARGTGGLTTNAVDLCQFARALMEGELLSPRSMRELYRAQPGRLGAGYSLGRAGLGWDTVAEPEFAAKGVTVLGKDGFTTVFRSQMFVAPRHKVAVATILAGPASLPGSVVIGMSKSIMFAALEDSGRMPHVREHPAPSLEPAPIPERMKRFAGVYAGMGHSIMRLTFDLSANTLDTARLVDGRFVPGASLQFASDGRFHGGDDPGYSFAVGRNGQMYLVQREGPQGMVTLAQRLSPGGGADTSEFKDVTWVPLDLRASDFVTLLYHGLYRTGTLDDVPGLVYLHDGNPGAAVAYDLASARRSRMILPYEADLVELEIVYRDGQKILKAGSFEYADASTAGPLQQDDRVTIESSGRNVARRVVMGGRFTSVVPPGARIVVYAPDGAIAFDSLFEGSPAVNAAPGSIVLFIGAPGTVFAARVSQT